MSNLEKLSRRRLSSRVESVGRPRTRKPKAGEVQQMSVSLDGGVVQAIDDELEKINDERNGPVWTRSDVIRIAVRDWLAGRRGKRAKHAST